MLTSALKFIIFIYDIVTLPIYALFQKPWRKRSKQNKIKAKRLIESDPTSFYTRVGVPPNSILNEFSTIDELFINSCQKHGDKKCFGVRPCFFQQQTTENNNKALIKRQFASDYKWYTYSEINKKMDNLMKGFILHGIKARDIVVIFLETRMEWIISAHALFRIGCTVATVYENLGINGILHSITDLKATHIITSSSLLPKLTQNQSKLKFLKCIIFIENDLKKVQQTDIENDLDKSIEFLSYNQLEKEGSEADPNIKGSSSKSSDLALIMYTSGSTGNPKGVMISHLNFAITLKEACSILSDYKLSRYYCYISYLPLAHILEFTVVHFALSQGFSVGFSSSLTLMNYSPYIKEPNKGDITLLKPDIFAAVPLILDRIRKDIMHEMEQKGFLIQKMFYYFIEYKNYWLEKGWTTPLVDYVIFKRFRSLLGGNVQFVLVGGASLPLETQKFCRTCLNVELVLCYGATEVTGAITILDKNDTTLGIVGAPVFYSQLRLVAWEEGGYTPYDKPNSRGEIVIHCESMALGYYNNEIESNQTFVKENGKRWFYSGDIGEIYPNGCLKIIDRKKDLVKLLTGEYISLGKVC